MDNQSPLVLVRGLPGSGKSTFASTLGRVLFEADDYFMVNGKYLFDINQIADAHKWCLWRTKAAINAGMKVVVANTFTRAWEMENYLDHWPDAPVYRCTGEYGSIHGVPQEAIDRMKARFEDHHNETIID